MVRWLKKEANDTRPLPVDVREDGEGYEIRASVPGLRPEELTIEILEDVVTLRGEVGAREDETGDYMLREHRSGKFERKLRLPEAVEAKGAEAKVKDGVLTLRLPKAEEARPRSIKVKAN